MVTKRSRDSRQPTCREIEDSRVAACRQLRWNVLEEGFIPDEGSPAGITVHGEQLYLPAYVPYVGPKYFGHRPRVLCYAINQNLSRHRRWTAAWISQWVQDSDRAIDRLNSAAAAGQALAIKPYVEGFMPLVAAMAFARTLPQEDHSDIPMVDDVIAATNFVKFSTADDASSSSIPCSWWRECANRYVREEIHVLAPDVVIGFGDRTVAELRRVLVDLEHDGAAPELLACRFPGRIPSIKARPLSAEERTAWEHRILPLAEKIRKPPRNSYHQWRMLRFPGYFLDIARSWGDLI